MICYIYRLCAVIYFMWAAKGKNGGDWGVKMIMACVCFGGERNGYRIIAALAAAILSLFAVFPAGAEDTVYEYAFVRVLPDYAIYYVFDVDTMTVRQFKTNDAGALVGTFTGDPVFGADIRYSRDWHESFHPVTPGDLSRVLITDYSGFTFEYIQTDPFAAADLMKNGGYYDIRLE